MNNFRTVMMALTIICLMWSCPALSQEQSASAAREEKKPDEGYLVLGNSDVTPGEVQSPSAQETQPGLSPALLEKLQGLSKALPGDLDPNKQIMLNPDTMPMYLEDGTRLLGKNFFDSMMSGNYVPEPYLNQNKDIRAFVLRKATEEEKRQLLSMMEQQETQGKPAMGKDAKPFSVTDIKGKKYSLDKLKGKIVVVNFWFMECKPCRMEIPELNKVVDKYGGKGIVFLGMSTNSKAQIEKFLEKNEFKYNIVPDSMAVAGKYGVTGFPTHMIIDRDSKVAYFSSGYGPGTIDELTGAIEQLIKK